MDLGEGVVIPAGARILRSYGSANRDERQFPDPARVERIELTGEPLRALNNITHGFRSLPVHVRRTRSDDAFLLPRSTGNLRTSLLQVVRVEPWSTCAIRLKVSASARPPGWA